MLVQRSLARVRLPFVKGSFEPRLLHASSSTRVQRLLWAGSVLDRTASSLQEVPKDWLLSLGVQADVEQGITFNHLAASPSHSLLSYTTLPPSLPVSASDDQSERDEYGRRRTHPAGLHKVIAVGRNTYGELGLGFSSQEATWGMVSSGFEGQGGIQALQCGLGSSWIVTSEGHDDASVSSTSSSAAPTPTSSSLIYSFGNHTSGQLGLGGSPQPHALSEGGEPQLQLYSSPRRVARDVLKAQRITRMAAGLDHTVILAEKTDGSQVIYTCGINTDGQLGDETVRITSPDLVALNRDLFDPPLPTTSDDPIVGVAAGGDSSILWTRRGRIWAWGNSEYGQCLVGSTKIDRISRPTEATKEINEAVEAKIVDIRLGGCFAVVLDEAGNVYTAGFGALGQGKENLQSSSLKKILTNAVSIATGLEQASAVIRDPTSKQDTLKVWGLDTATGRLGIGGRKPWPSYMIASRFTPEDHEHRIWQPCSVSKWRAEWAGKGGESEAGVKAVVHGRDTMWVLVEDGRDEVGRWASR